MKKEMIHWIKKRQEMIKDDSMDQEETRDKKQEKMKKEMIHWIKNRSKMIQWIKNRSRRRDEKRKVLGDRSNLLIEKTSVMCERAVIDEIKHFSLDARQKMLNHIFDRIERRRRSPMRDLLSLFINQDLQSHDRVLGLCQQLIETIRHSVKLFPAHRNVL